MLPPLLSDNETLEIELGISYQGNWLNTRRVRRSAIAQAQRKADMKWFIEQLEAKLSGEMFIVTVPREGRVTLTLEPLQHWIDALKKEL